jgi:multiphosphoryl transfer protein
MVGIVIVSHSRLLAEGVRELALQMSQEPVPVAVAAGIDATDSSIGTDPMAVQEAIEMVYSDDGVVVLMDLGSAVMSAEMALEFLEPAQRKNMYLTRCTAGGRGDCGRGAGGTGSTWIRCWPRRRVRLQAKQIRAWSSNADSTPTPTPTTDASTAAAADGPAKR